MAKGGIARDVRRAVNKDAGSRFWRLFTLTSSSLTTSATTLGTASTGRLMIKAIILQTDSTGLAGGTNFQLKTTNAKGNLTFCVETVANLGANATKTSNSTTSGAQPSVTNIVPCVLEAGQNITQSNTVAAGTGAGTIDVYIEFERVDRNADLIGGTIVDIQ